MDWTMAAMGPAGQAVDLVSGQAKSLANKFGLTSGFQATPPPIQTQDIISDINKVKGRPGEIDQQQQALANALLLQSQGKGPNPAQIALQQATNRNIQQQAGAMAAQKGINPALAQRQIAQNAAMQQQQAAGQGALMGAQQQLNAQGQLGNVYGQMAGQSLQNLGILENAQAAQNSAINQAYLGANEINANTAMGNAANMQKILGSAMNAAGGAAKMGAAHGAVVPGKAEYEGDTELNDKVPAMLSPGEIVIPRTAAKDADKAKAFIDKIKGSSSKSSAKEKGYGAVLEANRKLESRVAELEKRLKRA